MKHQHIFENMVAMILFLALAINPLGIIPVNAASLVSLNRTISDTTYGGSNPLPNASTGSQVSTTNITGSVALSKQGKLYSNRMPNWAHKNYTATASVCISPYFSLATSFTTGTGPHSVAPGNFNNDNILDLVTANYFHNTVSILLGVGNGSFSTATNYAVGAGPLSVKTGDFNEDGILDLATANQNGNSISVLMGITNGNFGVASSFGVGANPMSITTGDFNNDGNIDLATANSNSATVSILLGNGAGGFSAKTDFAVQSEPYNVVVGDFNKDNNQDLAVVNRVSHTVSILIGTGTGGFRAATNFPVGAQFPPAMTTSDFNADGNLDIATGNGGSGNISVLLGSGDGSFGAAANFPVGINPDALSPSDFNGDGVLDLAVTNWNTDNVSVLLGNGDGSFGAPTNFALGTNPRSVTVADFNQDGKQDIAATNATSNDVSILLNTCDIMAPVITINNPTTDPAQDKTITASVLDGTLTMSNTTGSTCDGTLTFIAYSSQTFNSENDNGTKVCYKAVDGVGNMAYSLSNAITGIDTTSPIVTIVTMPLALTAIKTASFSFNGTDIGSGIARFECQLDGSTFTTCASPKGYINLALGSHTFSVRAVDLAGNEDSIPATFSWKVVQERARNGGFNTYIGASKIPVGWVAAKFAATDGKDTNIANKKEGLASIKITGKAGTVKTLTQTITLSGVASDRLTFSFWAKGSAIPSTGICKANVMIYNGSTLKVNKIISCKSGSYAFTQSSFTFTAGVPYTKVVITFTYGKASGTIWFDLVSLFK